MGTVFERIEGSLAEWMLAQPLFFVATAPRADDGLVNCSPKGLVGSFVVLDEHTVAYLDLTGSGIETVAHLRENGRIVLMFCAFGKRPRIVRLHGTGRTVLAGDAEFEDLVARFPDHPGVRSVIVVSAQRISDSCGYAVPRMEYVSDRELLDLSAAKRGPEGLITYRAERNAVSLDGLPGLS